MFRNALLITCATLLLIFLALQNGFPILYPDTGAYIWSGFKGVVPMDRPIFYGLFLRHISLAESLWLVILAQSAILAWLLLKTVQRFVSAARLAAYYLFVVLALLWMTSLAYYADLLIPDIFTSISFLCAFHLVFWSEHKWPVRVSLALIFVFALITHLSHLPTMLVTLLVGTAIAYMQRKRVQAPFRRRHVALVLGLVLTAMTIVPSFNWVAEGHFRLSGGSNIFFTNRLRDLYLVEDFLAKDCKEGKWKLCDCRDKLIGDFLWDYNASPLYLTGGWEANVEEYGRMNRAILARPRFLLRYLRGSLEDGIRSFFSFHAGPASALGDDTSPAVNLKQYFARSWPAYRGTLQYRGELHLDSSNARQTFFALASMAMLLLGLLNRKRVANLPADLRWFVNGVIIFTISNAVICASLSNADARYAGRVVWLYPLAVLLVAIVYAERYNVPDRIWHWVVGRKQPQVTS